MGNRLEGKVAVVSGGGRGIGKGIAKLLATEGASVIVNDKGTEVDGSGESRTPADSVVEEIQSSGGTASANYADVSSMDGGESLIQSAVDTYGGLDVLVNSAGSLRDRMIYQMTPNDFDSVMKNNAKSAFTTTKFAAILFRQQRSGRIVNMVADSGLGDVGRSNYAAATEAIIGLTRTTAKDLGKYGITANAISALAETRLFAGSVEERRLLNVQSPTRDERAGIGPSPEIQIWGGEGYSDHPDNVAPLAVYLCTYASPNINGYVLGARGGSLYVYSNPEIEKIVNKWGNFTMEEMDSLFPKMMGTGF
ncbi:MAG: SDR family NAD(P)-dependent oxidoreductase [SAR202 cluster bacterium]|jgi:NAD(P)-dependent dehydrogenase (short-subunit alcohol dehydrogenase family)|nr:SDR family NAD(P)-dependent oxidoreductase [SAR202 cluster bacterium]|tara:strand:+ start:317 stop:1240 length:924 start_codon:yes stop_codon:yes gene_type:complete